MNGPRRMKELFETGKMIIAPGAHDALTAKIIGRLGFDAVYMTGYGQSASHLGQPDVGLMTMTEMAMRASAIVEAAGVPVVADADTGFGNAVNVMRTVREYEMAGVAVIQLEDQVLPKKCGHMIGRQLVPTEEMVGKIKAAAEARVNPDFMIMARTDARTSQGIEAAIKRGLAYKEAGADIIFIESPESEAEMKQINDSIPGYTLANMVEGGRTPMLHNSELEKLGYNLAIYPTASIYMTAKSMVTLWETLKKDGTTKHIMDQMVTFSEFNDLIGLNKVREIEGRFTTDR